MTDKVSVTPSVGIFESSPDLCSIVVVGHMNPAIHHPNWYKSVGAIKDEELEEAQNVPPQSVGTGGTPMPNELICTAAYSQFTAGKIRVVCTAENWSVLTTEFDLLPRTQEISSKVFRALPHTPIASFGFNFLSHRATRSQHVASPLVKAAEKLPLGVKIPKGALPTAKVHYSWSSGNRSVYVAIEPSVRAEDTLFVGVNISYQIEEKGFFDLDPIVSSNLERDRSEARHIIDAILRAVNLLPEV